MSQGLEKVAKNKYRFLKQERSNSCKDKFLIENKQQLNVKRRKKVILNIQKKVGQHEKEFHGQLQKKVMQQSVREQSLFKCFEEHKKPNRLYKVESNQENEIKGLLIKICANHKQMIGILQKILLKNSNIEQKDTNIQKNKPQQDNNDLPQLSKIVSNLKKQTSQVSTVFDEITSNIDTVITHNDIKMRQFSRASNICDRNSIFGSILSSEIVNKLLIQSIGIEKGISERTNRNYQEQKIRLRQLISRRFHAFSLNYTFFLQTLILTSKKSLNKYQLQKILKDTPFLLEESQIQLIKKTIFQTKLKKNQYKISDLAEKMRYFIEDRPSQTQNTINQGILQFKSIMKQKSLEIQQSMKKASSQNQYITLEELSKVLKSYMKQKNFIEYIISSLCVESNSINKIKFMKLFDQEWVKSIPK